MRRLLFLLFLGSLVWVGSAPKSGGYSLEVHRDLYDFAFGDRTDPPVSPPDEAGLAAFRRYVYRLAVRNPEFAARYPTEDAFDAAAFKQFVALNPAKSVYGFDRAPVGPQDGRTAWREASVYPDTDHRNQDRLAVKDGKVLVGADGKAIPYDPKTVWFGARIGTPSQFDAHGAMRRGPKSGSYFKAIVDPENFSTHPDEQLGSAPEFNQTYTDLAILARTWGGPGSEWLAINFAGNNFHGIEDLANQIHTTLVGSPWFFKDAMTTLARAKVRAFFHKLGTGLGRLAFWRRRRHDRPAAPAFDPAAHPLLDGIPIGVFQDVAERIKRGKPVDDVDPRILYALDKLPTEEVTLVSVGTLILDNFHRLLEDYFQEAYLQARSLVEAGRADAIPNRELRALFQTARAGDAAFEAELRAATRGAANRREFARIIAEKLIEKSAPEAAPIYTSIRAISDKRLRGSIHYRPDAGDRPLDYIRVRKGRHNDRIFRLHARAFARAVTALRLWREIFDEVTDVRPGTPEAERLARETAERLVARQLAYHRAAKARRIRYLREVAEKVGQDPASVTDPLEGVEVLATDFAPKGGAGLIQRLPR